MILLNLFTRKLKLTRLFTRKLKKIVILWIKK